MRLILLAAFACYMAVIGALALFQRRLIYPGAYAPPPVPATRGEATGASAIMVETGDGERLLGLWRPPAPGCGIVVTFHGNASLPEPQAARFAADPWRAGGWGVLAIAYRGYPGSTGAPSEGGLIADGLAAHREAAARAPGAPILLHGHSLGAAIAVAVAAREPHAGLYLEAPFDSLAHVVTRRYPFVPSLFLMDHYRSDQRIPSVGGPVLIVHGRSDPVIPPLARGQARRSCPAARADGGVGGRPRVDPRRPRRGCGGRVPPGRLPGAALRRPRLYPSFGMIEGAPGSAPASLRLIGDADARERAEVRSCRQKQGPGARRNPCASPGSTSPRASASCSW